MWQISLKHRLATKILLIPMVLLFVHGIGGTSDTLTCENSKDLCSVLSDSYGLCKSSFYVTSLGGLLIKDDNLEDGDTVVIKLKVNGGIDFQHREGSKVWFEICFL